MMISGKQPYNDYFAFIKAAHICTPKRKQRVHLCFPNRTISILLLLLFLLIVDGPLGKLYGFLYDSAAIPGGHASPALVPDHIIYTELFCDFCL
jgi:hypothetical protein